MNEASEAIIFQEANKHDKQTGGTLKSKVRATTVQTDPSHLEIKSRETREEQRQNNLDTKDNKCKFQRLQYCAKSQYYFIKDFPKIHRLVPSIYTHPFSNIPCYPELNVNQTDVQLSTKMFPTFVYNFQVVKLFSNVLSHFIHIST